MPPKNKKKEVEKPPLILGRLKTSLKIGIVGIPNVGKSTFFNVLTKSQAQAENFPFCTIDPNESRVPVPDERWEYLCKYHKPASKVPAFLNVVDIAGLVKGAAEGAGLGNAFLSNISSCDAIFHMTRAFDDKEVVHVDGEVNPVRDMATIQEELRLKDVEHLTKRLAEVEKVYTRGNNKQYKQEFETLQKIKVLLVDQEKPVRCGEWSGKDIEILNEHLFLTAKPQIYLVNLSEKDYARKKNKWLMKIKQWVDEFDPKALLIPFSGVFEYTLMDMADDAERESYLKEKYDGKVQSNLDKIVVNGFKALGLEYFFTAGKDEVKAWTIKKNSFAPQAAGRIHSDFEKGFIMAEVMQFADFKEHGSEAAAKAAGKYHQKGRTYVVQDGDIINFKFNTPNAPKKK